MTGTITSERYPRLPLSLYLYKGKYATKEEKSLRRKSVSAFLENAKAGDRYVAGGIGGDGLFEIVEDRRSKNGLGIRWKDSNTVMLNRKNTESFIRLGARKV